MIPQIEHFIRDLTPEQAKALFKSSVSVVAIAISSYCNRRCAYCPNAIVDRKSTKNFMSDALFFSIVRHLTVIDYSGKIYLHRYNEPLADREYALSRIRDLRAFVPNASIEIFTNGDYLDRSYLASLAQLGVSAINSTVHAGPGGKTDITALVEEQDRRMAELDVSFEIEGSVDEKCRVATARYESGMTFSIAAHDFYRGEEHGSAWAFDRAGTLPIPKRYRRKLPCLIQFTEMEIEWDGTLLPCCQISEAVGHQDYVLGKLDPGSDLFATWTNSNYINWRFRMSDYKQKSMPCATCNYGEPMGQQPQLKQRLDQLHTLVAKYRVS